MQKVIKIPAIRGIQARAECYTAMVPVKLLPKLFPGLESFPSQKAIAIEQRYQRELEPSRAKAIARYVANGMSEGQTYTLSAISASIKSPILEFKATTKTVGSLVFGADAEIYLFDGQHRVRGLILAAERDAAVQNETIPIVLYRHVSRERDQQAFSDMNSKVRIPPKSLTMAFDHRDPSVALAREILDVVPELKSLIDFDRASCSRSNALLFWFQEFWRANQILLNGVENPVSYRAFAIAFWQQVVKSVEVYDAVRRQAKHAQTAREESVAPTQLALLAIATQGAQLRDLKAKAMKQGLEPISTFDWRKTNPQAQAVCAANDRVLRSLKAAGTLREMVFEQQAS